MPAVLQVEAAVQVVQHEVIHQVEPAAAAQSGTLA